VEAKRGYKSFRYKAKTTWSSGRRGTLSAPGKPDVVVGSPPEFKGDPSFWAPEELLVASVNTCMMLTFLTPKVCLSTSKASIGSRRSRFGRASASKANLSSNVPAKSWKASKPSALSQIPSSRRSCSLRILSLLPRSVEWEEPRAKKICLLLRCDPNAPRLREKNHRDHPPAGIAAW